MWQVGELGAVLEKVGTSIQAEECGEGVGDGFQVMGVLGLVDHLACRVGL